MMTAPTSGPGLGHRNRKEPSGFPQQQLHTPSPSGPQLNRLGVPRSSDALRLILQSGESSAGTITCTYATSHTWCVPGKRPSTPAGCSHRSTQLGPLGYRELPQALLLSSAHQCRCEVRRASGPSVAEPGPGGLRAAPSVQRTAPHFSEPIYPGYAHGLRSACPSGPLCPWASVGHQQDTGLHTAGCGMCSLPERIMASVPASCLVAHCSLTPVIMSLLSSSLARPPGSFWEDTRLSGTPS